MKVKTSITLSRGLVDAVDRLAGPAGNRSAVIERAVRALVDEAERRAREERDRVILDRRAAALNREAEDVLSYQVEL